MTGSVDLPIQLDALSGQPPTPKETQLYATHARLKSQNFAQGEKAARALRRLHDSVQSFERKYDIRKSKGDTAGLSDWDDKSLLKALGQAAPKNIFEASQVFRSAIQTTVTHMSSTGEETRKKAILNFIVKLFPLVKILITLGEVAAQVQRFSGLTLSMCSDFGLRPCCSCVAWIVNCNGGKICPPYNANHFRPLSQRETSQRSLYPCSSRFLFKPTAF